MAKDVLDSRCKHHLIYELGMDELGQFRLTGITGIAEHDLQHLQAEAGADYRCGVERSFSSWRESIDTRSDRRLQCRRHTDIGDLKLAAVRATLTDDHLSFGELAHYFLDIERVSRGMLDDVRCELIDRWMRPDELGGHLPRS